jgi:hypothetical protein
LIIGGGVAADVRARMNARQRMATRQSMYDRQARLIGQRNE